MTKEEKAIRDAIIEEIIKEDLMVLSYEHGQRGFDITLKVEFCPSYGSVLSDTEK